MPESPERGEKARKHFQERGLTDVTFFDGIHAEKAGIRTVNPYEVDNPGSGFNIGFRVLGVALSHIMLWSALRLLWDENFLILEDDCCLPEDWHVRLSNAMRDVPQGWDMLYAGNCCCQGKPSTHIAGEVYEVKGPLCTHMYAVARKALPTLLRTHRKLYGPVDCTMVFHSHPLLKVYSVLPSIASQFDTILSP